MTLFAKVFVDPLTVYPNAWGPFLNGSCHMFARLADAEELHNVAARIGLKRSWFQGDKDGGHYDLTPRMRKAALKEGVAEIDFRGAVEIWRSNRNALRGITQREETEMARTKPKPEEEDDDVFARASAAKKSADEKKSALRSTEAATRFRSELSESVKEKEISDEAPKEEPKFDPATAVNEFVGRHKTTDVKVDPKLERISESVVNVDALGEFDRLESELKIGATRTEYAYVVKALDCAEDNARIAHKLFISAKAEFTAWSAEQEVVIAPMRTEATRELEREKREGLRSKQITDADVTAKMAALFPDEFVYQEKKRAKLKLTLDHLEKFSELFSSRCRSLQALISTMRK